MHSVDLIRSIPCKSELQFAVWQWGGAAAANEHDTTQILQLCMEQQMLRLMGTVVFRAWGEAETPDDLLVGFSRPADSRGSLRIFIVILLFYCYTSH